MRQSEILIIRYRRVTVIEHSQAIRVESVESDAVSTETKLSPISKPGPAQTPRKTPESWFALITRLFNR
jgi:hypothetical protein